MFKAKEKIQKQKTRNVKIKEKLGQIPKEHSEIVFSLTKQ